ncbi:DUF1353 domain-containing protein [Brevundimonas vesicularis]|uniref:DUF1353 domain-containing protein n=1 Tax=Brevundimonas vesicularis TaxID=41276 RepID=UPI00384A9DFD
MPPSKPRRRFPHKLYLVLLDNRDGPAIRDGRSLWALQRPMSYYSGPKRDEEIIVPAGFVTDLTSIPRLVWSFYPPDGPWVKAAIVHDFLYDTQGDGRWNDTVGVTRATAYSRKEADDILLEGMIERNVGRWERLVIWLAVNFGGQRGWDRAGEIRAERQKLGKPIAKKGERAVSAPTSAASDRQS